jgi:Reverse transcriptase (RNA-dependent DNA polymerase).
MVEIHKKTNANTCKNFRTLSLVSHASKILANIIKRRLENILEDYLDQDQYGFRKNRVTREGILALRQIMEKKIVMKKKLAIGFIDLEKAFDNVNWKGMFEILKNLGVKFKERRAIFNIYKDQTATIEMGEHTEEAKVRKGVRQGCGLSPELFNLYIEAAINEIKEKEEQGAVSLCYYVTTLVLTAAL